MSTTRCCTAALAAALFCLVTGAASAEAQNSLWETYNDSGEQAFEAGEYAKAQKLFESALKEAEGFGPSDPRLATSLNNLALLYATQGKYDQAEPLYKRSLAIREKALGPHHPDVAASLNNVAELYRAQGKYDQAEPLYQRSLASWEKALGPDHPDVATALENYALLLRATKRDSEAAPMEARAAAIRGKHAKDNPGGRPGGNGGASTRAGGAE